jgi:hypothetical protein
MAIVKITGVLGAGKTYLAVHHLLKKYYDFNKKTGEVKLKEKYEDLTLITNIDQLKLEHINLDQTLKENNLSIETFFTQVYQEKIHKKYPNIVYVLDECQRYFDRKFYNKEVFFYFEYSRHFGDDIFLITQDQSKLSKDIGILAEYELRALPRSLSLAGEFKYKKLIGGQQIDTQVIRPNKHIFALYKSMTRDETEKIKKPFVKLILIPLCLLPIMAYISYRMVLPEKAEADKSKAEIEEQKQEQARKKSNNHLDRHRNKKTTYRIRLKGFIEINGKITMVVDPITGELLPVKFYEHPIALVPPRTLYARVDYDTYQQYIAATEPPEGGRGWAGDEK